MGKIENELLQRYFDDALDDAERARVEAALTEEDRERLAALGELRALMGALASDAPAVDLWPGIEAGLAAQARKKASVRLWRERTRARFVGAGMLVAALGAFLFLVRPWHAPHPTNNCDVESLEVDGALAGVYTMPDSPHRGDGNTTIIWMNEE
jgi:anti-sigma factor RsiW